MFGKAQPTARSLAKGSGTFVIVGVLLIAWGGCTQPTGPAHQPDTSLSVVPQRAPLSGPFSLGILPFDDHANLPGLIWLRQGLPDMLTTDLAVWPGIEVVSRSLLGEILREQWLQHRGTSDPSSTVKIGKLVGTRYLLKGSFYVVKDQLFLEAHLLDVERGTVVRTMRTSGGLTTIPTMEHTLAQQIGENFGKILPPALPQKTVQKESHLDPQPDSRIDSVEKESSSNMVSPAAHIPRSSASRTQLLVADALLNQERSQGMKEEAWLAADELWSQGLSVELGAVRYTSLNTDDSVDSSLPMVWVPVSAFLKPEKLSATSPALTFSTNAQNDNSSNQGIFIWKGENPTADRLFKENLRAPRRLFVRAISADGEVVALSSAWSWRVEKTVEFQKAGTFHISVWPMPIIKGQAGFPTMMVSGYGEALSFDTVVVPVPSEHRLVSVEIINPTDGENPESDQLDQSSSKALKRLQEWLLEQWDPPVLESIPNGGYLPGNRRTAQMLISGEGGIIREARLSQIPGEPSFGEALTEIAALLKGQCVLKCRQAVPGRRSRGPSFRLRIQFDLVKDLRQAGLGTHP